MTATPYYATSRADYPSRIEADAEAAERGPHVPLPPAERAALVAEVARLQGSP